MFIWYDLADVVYLEWLSGMVCWCGVSGMVIRYGLSGAVYQEW
ncbi:hypothetical protein [Bacillus sp. FJAT-27264]|nr:hypothetical protein [Bacillus sp. FJAT-27264]